MEKQMPQKALDSQATVMEVVKSEQGSPKEEFETEEESPKKSGCRFFSHCFPRRRNESAKKVKSKKSESKKNEESTKKTEEPANEEDSAKEEVSAKEEEHVKEGESAKEEESANEVQSAKDEDSTEVKKSAKLEESAKVDESAMVEESTKEEELAKEKEEPRTMKESGKRTDAVKDIEPNGEAQQSSVKEVLDSCRVHLVESIGHHIESILDQLISDNRIGTQEYYKIKTIKSTRTPQDSARELLDYIIRTRSYGPYVSLKKGMTSARLEGDVRMLEKAEKCTTQSQTGHTFTHSEVTSESEDPDTSKDPKTQKDEQFEIPPTQTKDVNLLLVGCKGNGKSSTGNTILGKNVFTTSKKVGTKKYRRKEICCRAPWDKTLEIMVRVTDTPGVSEQMTESEFLELEKAVNESKEGFDAIVLVWSDRMSPNHEHKEDNVFKSLHRMFGPSFPDHLFIVVTEITQDDVPEFCSNLPESLKTIKDQSLNILGFDNKNKEACEGSKWELISDAIKHSKEKGRLISKEYQVPSGDELRIAVIGNTGAGKSSTANSIGGVEMFKVTTSASSTTKQCSYGKRWKGDREIAVADSPGVWDTDASMEDISEEITRIATIFSAGLHALVLVIAVGKFTRERMLAVQVLKKIFGDNFMKYVVIVITRRDEMVKGDVKEYLKSAPPELKNLIEECNGRYVAFDNKTKDETVKRKQVRELVKLIDDTVEKNGGVPFTNSIFQEGQKEKDEIKRQYMKELMIEIRQTLPDTYGEVDEVIEHAISTMLQKKMRDKHQLEENVNVPSSTAMQSAVSTTAATTVPSNTAPAKPEHEPSSTTSATLVHESPSTEPATPVQEHSIATPATSVQEPSIATSATPEHETSSTVNPFILVHEPSSTSVHVSSSTVPLQVASSASPAKPVQVASSAVHSKPVQVPSSTAPKPVKVPSSTTPCRPVQEPPSAAPAKPEQVAFSATSATSVLETSSTVPAEPEHKLSSTDSAASVQKPSSTTFATSVPVPYRTAIATPEDNPPSTVNSFTPVQVPPSTAPSKPVKVPPSTTHVRVASDTTSVQLPFSTAPYKPVKVPSRTAPGTAVQEPFNTEPAKPAQVPSSNVPARHSPTRRRQVLSMSAVGFTDGEERSKVAIETKPKLQGVKDLHPNASETVETTFEDVILLRIKEHFESSYDLKRLAEEHSREEAATRPVRNTSMFNQIHESIARFFARLKCW